jgi:hypothetical protein
MLFSYICYVDLHQFGIRAIINCFPKQLTICRTNKKKNPSLQNLLSSYTTSPINPHLRWTNPPKQHPMKTPSFVEPIHPKTNHPMPATRSGNSYNMSNHQIPNKPNPRQPNIQQQITRITAVLEQLTHRLDVMDERRARARRRSPNRKGRGPFQAIDKPLPALYDNTSPKSPDFLTHTTKWTDESHLKETKLFFIISSTVLLQ